jgi:NADH:ubiquinone oxidoreductase subunit 6 (subunit J)
MTIAIEGFWICSGLALVAGGAACFVADIKRAVLSLWVAGLAVGGIYLSVGAELLAVVQWIVATIVAMSFIFYSVMFGEYGKRDPRPLLEKAKGLILPLLIGVAFVGILAITGQLTNSEIQPAATPAAGQSLLDLGRRLASEHLLSLEVLGLSLFLVIVGSGVIARPEVIDPDAEGADA